MKLQERLRAAFVGRSIHEVRPAPPAHSILNHRGVEIPVSWRTIKTLSLMKALRWNRELRKRQIQPEMAAFLIEFIRQPYFVPRGLRAQSLQPRTRSGLPPNPLLLELGPELDGAAAVDCDCRACTKKLEDSDRTHLPWDVANRIHTQGAH